MGARIDEPSYTMMGALATDLCVAVRSSLPQVSRYLAATRFFEPSSDYGYGAFAAEVSVTADPAAPQRRYFLDEFYTRIQWLDATHAQVQTNGATGSIEWQGTHDSVLRAELRIFPEAAPESLGMFLRLLASLLLPSRRGVLIHASAVIIGGEGCVFLGESGAGKTTTARRTGREGAMRIADDLAVLRVESPSEIFVEPCRFDKGGRLPGRANHAWPLRAAYHVRKGAAVTADMGPVKNPLATWCAAVLSSTGPPGSLDSLLTLTGSLSQAAAPRALHVRASGSVLPVLTQAHCHPLAHASSVYE